MKKLIITSILFYFHGLLLAQSENEIYDLVSSNMPSAYTLDKAEQCQPYRFNLKSLYFVDQQEPANSVPLKVTCKNFASMVNPLAHFESIYRANFKTHTSQNNLNLVIVDVLSNGLFQHEINTIMVPWHFNASFHQLSLKNPIHSIPILLHEYGHYLIHHNSNFLNYNFKNRSRLNLYFDALHELLSDVLVVLFYNDPKIMMNALKSTLTVQYPDGRTNDAYLIEEKHNWGQKKSVFKYTLRSRDFDNTQNTLDVIMGKFRSGDKFVAQGYFYAPHSLLAPIRKYLWDYMLSNPQILQDAGGKSGLAVYLTVEFNQFFKYLTTLNYPSTMKPHEIFEFINKELKLWLDKGLVEKKYKKRFSLNPNSSFQTRR